MSANFSEHKRGLNPKFLSMSKSLRLIIWTALAIVFIITFLDIAGSIFDLTLFKRIIPEWEPMKPVTAICFIISTLTLLIIWLDFHTITTKVISIFLACLLCFTSLISLYIYFYSFSTAHESPVSQISLFGFFLSPDKRMAFLTACSFLFLGCILILLSRMKDKASGIAHIFVFPVFLISYFTIVSYLLGVYTATEFSHISDNLNTVIVFCGICLVVFLMRPDTWFMQLYKSRYSAGIISRKLLPALIILPIVIGWIRIHGERIGLIKSEEGVVIVATSYTFCFLILTWLTARAIERIDLKRRSVEEALLEREERLKFHFENSPLAVIEWDHNFIVTQWSVEAERIFGWGKSETIGLHIDALNMIFEEDIPVVEKTMKSLSEGTELKVVSENRNYTKSREIRNCVWYNSVLLDEKGQMSSVMSLVEDVTEIRKVEKLLRESEEKLWSVLNATRESIYMFDKNGMITMSNSTGTERLGINSENGIIGHHFSEFMAPSTALKRQVKIDEVFSSGKPLEFEDERDGRMFNHNFFPVFKDDKVSFVVTYSTEITERKIAEVKLKESEDRFRTIAESLPVLISIYNVKNSTYSFVNESYEKAFGFKKGELLNKKLPDSFFNPEDHKNIGNLLKANGRAYNKEIRVKKADGTSFWIMTSIKKIFFKNEPSYLTASIDITETKKALGELIRLNRTLNASSKSSLSMMHCHDEFSFLNEVCKIIIEDCGYKMVWAGYAQNDMRKSVKPVASYGFDKGYTDQMNITWDDSELGRGPTGTAIRTGKPTLCKNMLTDPAFEPWREAAIERGYASSLVIPLISERKPFGAITIYSEEPDPFSESEIKLLTDLAADLAYGISFIRLTESERAAARAVKESEAKLIELVATKDKFFNIVAHDLKNPFTSLLGSSELLIDNLNQMSSENVRELALILNDSAKIGYAILQNLLDWSRSQTGLLKFNPENVNLKLIIDENIDNIFLQVANKGISLRSELTEDIFIYADKNMINTVLRNFLSNAVKYTFKNGTILVRVSRTPEEIIIAVKDSGIGISKEKVDTLFKIENSLSLPGTEKEQGTGLGLKLCKEFTEKMGGRIWVESNVDQGSEFKFTIPLKGAKA
jgi:PAS domain S-box-containing protein